MPNHVMNIVCFSGDRGAIRRMREAIQNPEYGIGSIDFNRIIPMPPSLDMEESSCTRAGLRAYGDGRIAVRYYSDLIDNEQYHFDEIKSRYPDTYDFLMSLKDCLSTMKHYQ